MPATYYRRTLEGVSQKNEVVCEEKACLAINFAYNHTTCCNYNFFSILFTVLREVARGLRNCSYLFPSIRVWLRSLVLVYFIVDFN